MHFSLIFQKVKDKKKKHWTETLLTKYFRQDLVQLLMLMLQKEFVLFSNSTAFRCESSFSRSLQWDKSEGLKQQINKDSVLFCSFPQLSSLWKAF